MVALSAAFAAVIEDAYVHANGDMPALSNLIFQTKPKEFFKKLNRSGPEYEKKGNKKGKHYRSLQNVRKTWTGEGVLETKVLQYVAQEIRDRFKEQATPLPASAGVNESANIQSELEAANARLLSQLEAANAKLIEKVSLPDIIVASISMHFRL